MYSNYASTCALNPTSMTTIEDPHIHLRYEEKLLHTINANIYREKG